MFEDLFIDRDAIARYRAAPLLRERLSYLRHCAREGARPLTLRRIAATQLTLIRFWICVRASVSACPGSRRRPTADRVARHSR